MESKKHEQSWVINATRREKGKLEFVREIDSFSATPASLPVPQYSVSMGLSMGVARNGCMKGAVVGRCSNYAD